MPYTLLIVLPDVAKRRAALPQLGTKMYQNASTNLSFWLSTVVYFIFIF
jgi:hypothetical protein